MTMPIAQVVQTGLALVFVLGGLFFLSISSSGIIRFPDFYCRNHAVGKSETLGSMLVLFGLAIYNGFEINSGKLVIIILFIMFANPTATHIIGRAAYRSGLQVWSLEIKRPGEHAELTKTEQLETKDGIEDKER
jgi:multicomponent Na+:H+ antiporter subunit G